MFSVCIISAFYPPHLGGVEFYAERLGQELTRAGNIVTIITSTTDSCTVYESRDGINLIKVPSKVILDGRLPLLKISINFFSFMQHILQQHFDAVIINTRYYPICLLGAYIAKKNNINPIVIDHSSNFLFTGVNLKAKLFRSLEMITTKFFLKKKTSFYAVSTKSSIWLKKIGINTRGILPNSINPEEYLTSMSPMNWRNKLSLDSKAFLVLFAGRLIKEKGIIEAINSISIVNNLNNTKNIHLCIAGDGPLKKEIENIKDSNIHFVGKLSSQDLASLMSCCDVFCFPSTYPEGLPTVLLEAGVNSLGIIMTDTGGRDELIPSDSYGITLDKADPETIAKAINIFYTDRQYLRSCGKAIAARISNNFTWEKTAQVLITEIRNKTNQR